MADQNLQDEIIRLNAELKEARAEVEKWKKRRMEALLEVQEAKFTIQSLLKKDGTP